MKKLLLLFLLLYFGWNAGHAQTASLGGVVNKYTAITDIISSCKIRVNDPSQYAINDQVLIIQMKGASLDLTNTSNFGSVTNLNEAGKFEFNYIDTINGDTVTLVYQLKSPDYDPDEKMQMIYVPTYDVINVTGTLLPAAWNGETGGIVVIEAKDSITLFNDIDVNGKGYRGGRRSKPNYTCNELSYSYSEFNNVFHGGYKGESFSRFNAQHVTGRGTWGTGGGGGNNHNSGGGGGGNFAAGGLGGKQSYINSGSQGCNDTTTVNGGIGGRAFNYANFKDRVFLGGGGGGGHQNDLSSGGGGEAGKGGNGGGAVILVAPTIYSFNRTILANGQGVDSIAGRDGAGGGGAGGSVLLYCNQINGGLTIQAKGGQGGDNNSHNNLSFNLAATHGTGGGGAGGYVGVQASSMFSAVALNAAGGRNGKVLNSASIHYNLNYGAMPGSNGNSVTGLTLPRGNTPCKVTILVPSDDQGNVTKNSSVFVKVKANDFSNRGTRVSICQSPANGIASVANFDSIFYQPNNNYVGKDTLIYCLCTTIQPQVCDNATVIIDVTEVKVDAIKDFVLTFINYPTVIDVLDNDSINVSVNAVLLNAPLFGNASWNGSTFDYTPGNNFTGLDSFQYRICSSTVPQVCDNAWVIIDVSVGVQCINDFVQVPMNTPQILKPKSNDQISLPTVLSFLKSPSHGVAFALNGDSISYSPQPGYFGFDTIIYKVCSFNPVQLCDSAFIFIRVLPQLSASNDAYTVFMSRNLRSKVTVNDTIFGGFTTGIVKAPVYGQAALISSDSILYTAPSNFQGIDSLQYVICSSIVPGYCDTATVYYTITKQVQAFDDIATTLEDVAIRIGVEGNDIFQEQTRVRILVNPQKGFVSVDASDTVTYGPSPDEFGVDSFRYLLCTQLLPEVCDTAWVYITITPKNDPPLAVFDTASTTRNRGIYIHVMANDYDPDGNPISMYIVSQPNVGTVRMEDTLMYFTPGKNYLGQDRFQYGLCDDQSPQLCDTTDVFINVREREDLTFPNGFSPNKDGINDTWVIDGIEALNEYELLVLNRWGNVVWKTNYYTNDWEGVNTQNQPLPDGTYFYILKIIEEGTVEKGYLVIQRQ